MTIERHNEVYVLRDDLLPGGTKSVFLPSILDHSKERFVYASPVYGGMQIALAKYCSSIGKQAVIFSAKRKIPHPNSIKVKEAGGLVYQVPYGYLSNCTAKAIQYVRNHNAQLINFGADYPEAITAIANRMQAVSETLGFEPDEIFCAVGSGTLLTGIIAGTNSSLINGVQVGAQLDIEVNNRLSIFQYHKPFEYETKILAPFSSCANYDRKAWEYCLKYKKKEKVFFWNVL